MNPQNGAGDPRRRPVGVASGGVALQRLAPLGARRGPAAPTPVHQASRIEGCWRWVVLELRAGVKPRKSRDIPGRGADLVISCGFPLRPTRKLLDAARRAASGSCGPRVPHKTLTPMSRFTAQAASNLAVKREILRIAPRCRGLAAGPAARRRGAGRSAGLPGRDARCGQHGPVRGRQGRRPRQRRGADLRLRARRNALRVVPRLTPRRARHALEPSTDDDDLTGVKDETVAAVQREVLRQRLLVFAKIRQRRIRVQREADDSSWQVGGRPEVSC